MSKIIFFSWQSDISNSKQYVTRLLETFVKENPEYRLEAADRNPEGADDITKVIFEKIRQCDYFVADISIINPEDRVDNTKRLVCNPNVLYELGYATALDNVQKVLVCDKTTVDDAKHLPFDLRNRRIILRKFDTKSQKNLYDQVAYALKVKPRADAVSIQNIVDNIISAKQRVINPEYVVEHTTHGAIAQSLKHFPDLVKDQLSLLRRNLPNDVELVNMLAAVIEEVRTFSAMYPTIGPESHQERVGSLTKINNVLDEMIDYIIEHGLVDYAEYKTNIEDFEQSLKEWVDEISERQDLQMSTFYKFTTGVALYCKSLIYENKRDRRLLDIIYAIQPLQGYLAWHDMEDKRQALKSLLDGS